MSSTNKTTNYNLSQFVGTDVPSYLGDYNSDMSKIDKAIGDVANSQGSVEQSVTGLTAEVQGLSTQVSGTSTSVQQLQTTVAQIDTAYKQADTALSQRITTNANNIQANTTAIESANTAIEGINTTIGTADISGIGDGTIKGAISNINSSLIYNNAGYHNSVFRGKNLGTTVTDAQYNAISAGTFEDLYIGDYWVINGITWRIAHFDYWMNCGDTATTKHHIVVVPDTSLYKAAMNSSNVTTGGYAGSAMRSSALTDALSTAKTAFNNHVLSVRRLFTNAVSNGRASGSEWADSECDIMSEPMVYGHYIYTPISDGTNVAENQNVDYKQLALFVLAPQFICNREWYWLLNVVNNSYFSRVTNYGSADYGEASAVNGVRPAIAITGN